MSLLNRPLLCREWRHQEHSALSIRTIQYQAKHPELVAQGVERFAAIVGRERVLAGTDCGFGTFAGFGKLDGEIAYKKLKALADGAAIASKWLWGRA